MEGNDLTNPQLRIGCQNTELQNVGATQGKQMKKEVPIKKTKIIIAFPLSSGYYRQDYFERSGTVSKEGITRERGGANGKRKRKKEKRKRLEKT